MRYEPNRQFEKQMQKDPGVRRVLQDAADEAGDLVHATARAADWDQEFIDSIDSSDASLSTSSPTGHLREWGSKNNPPEAPLRKAVEQVGARFVAEPKQ